MYDVFKFNEHSNRSDLDKLYILIGVKSEEGPESMCYMRTISYIEYDPNVDELSVNMNDYISEYEIKHTTKLPYTIQEHIQGYTCYGETKIRGKHMLLLERTFQKPVSPPGR